HDPVMMSAPAASLKSPPGLPLPGPGNIGEWGHVLADIARHGFSLELLTTLRQRFGDFVDLDFGLRRIHLIANPAAVVHILQGNAANYIKATPYEEAALVLGNGLLNSEGDFWRRQRRLVQPSFQK